MDPSRKEYRACFRRKDSPPSTNPEAALDLQGRGALFGPSCLVLDGIPVLQYKRLIGDVGLYNA